MVSMTKTLMWLQMQLLLQKQALTPRQRIVLKSSEKIPLRTMPKESELLFWKRKWPKPSRKRYAIAEASINLWL